MLGLNKGQKNSLSAKIETVGEIVSGTPYLVFSPSDSIELIVREMQCNQLGVAGIVDHYGRLIGFLTERDILRKIFGVHGETKDEFNERNQHLSIYPKTLTAWDVMVTNPVCLKDSQTIESALDIIVSKGFRFMPVVKAANERQMIGIVSERELFWHAQNKIRQKLDSQTSILSYLMHHEDYGGAGGSLADNNFYH